MKPRMVYIANVRIPTERAQGVHVMHMCEAFAKNGMSIELIVPWRFNAIKEDPYDYYAVEHCFPIRRIVSLDLVWLPKIGFWLQERSFLFFVKFFLLSRAEAMLYIRGENVAKDLVSFAKKQQHPFYIESHALPKKIAIYAEVFKQADGVVVITRQYERDLRALGISRVLTAPDAVALDRFSTVVSKEQCRERVQLPQHTRIVGYVGKYRTNDQPKGVEDLIAAFSDLSAAHKDILLLLVGINADEMADVKKLFKEAGIKEGQYRIVGHVRQAEIPNYVQACDVLVMNYPALGHYVQYMSPLKLFEYMASGVPIISTDLPSIRDILNESNALLVPPESRSDLSQGILALLDDPARAATLAAQALHDVQQYSWEKRAGAILSFIETSSLDQAESTSVSIGRVYKDYTTIIRYAVSGGSGAAIQFASFYLLNEIAGVWYLYAVFLSFIVALCVVFLMQKFWTFRSFSRSLFKREFLSYSVIAIFGIMLNAFFMYSMVDLFGMRPIVSQALAIIAVTPVSYFLNRTITFAL